MPVNTPNPNPTATCPVGPACQPHIPSSRFAPYPHEVIPAVRSHRTASSTGRPRPLPPSPPRRLPSSVTTASSHGHRVLVPPIPRRHRRRRAETLGRQRRVPLPPPSSAPMTPVQAGAAPASPSAAAALGFLLPTCWEIEVTCAAAMILVALYAAYELLAPRPASAAGGSSAAGDDLLLVRDLDGADKVTGGLALGFFLGGGEFLRGYWRC